MSTNCVDGLNSNTSSTKLMVLFFFLFIFLFLQCSSCDPDDLDGGSYQGKIVLCPGQEGYGLGPKLAGAAGAVLVGDQPDVAFPLPLPALVVSQDQFDEILAYVNSTR
jgi:hypothetical protein